ncbi:GNAT family protein [Sodalis endosymbiont of Spalangia cameroni]|uniref:GNAT family N-acetyltransferase n=1 Tax=Sodalis praecaptivus TaxID=1239307 RepID=UPI0031F952B4
MPAYNEYDQPIGDALCAWQARPQPQRVVLTGRSCRLEPLTAAHFDTLYDAWAQAEDGRDWTYLPVERPVSRQACRVWLTALAASEDPLFFTVVDRDGDRAVGTVALMRIAPAHGVAEIGWVNWSRGMRRSRMGTEAIALLLAYLFDTLGYRRCEWKCDSLNAPSRQAARRLGFCYEGTFRQAIVTKGRNRDTSWFAIVDADWPAIRAAYTAWLANDNVDANGGQRRALGEFMPA